jgi:hypothetical protein
MFELEEGSRRAESLRNEYSAQLAAAREEFARQVNEASTQLAEARSECRNVADQANRDAERAEDVVAYLLHRYERRSRSARRTRFHDYLRVRPEQRSELTAIRNSAFFDPEFYLDSNPDVRDTGMDAAFHYLVHGGREGRDPGPFFSTHQYLTRFPDVAVSGSNALAHYEMYGRREMRRVLVSNS